MPNPRSLVSLLTESAFTDMSAKSDGKREISHTDVSDGPSSGIIKRIYLSHTDMVT